MGIISWKGRPFASVWRVAMLLLATLVLAGCDTVASRIDENRAYFAKLAPDEQAAIRRGEVRLGFSKRMAVIALGEPDEMRIRTDASGKTDIWRYQYYQPIYQGSHFVGYEYYDVTNRAGKPAVVRVPRYEPVVRYEAHEYLRLVFREGVVTEIERIE